MALNGHQPEDNTMEKAKRLWKLADGSVAWALVDAWLAACPSMFSYELAKHINQDSKYLPAISERASRK